MDNSTDRCRFYRGAETGLRGWRHGDMAVTKRWENVLKRRDEHLVAMRRCEVSRSHQKKATQWCSHGSGGKPWATMATKGTMEAEMEYAGKDAKSQDETLKIIQKTSLNLFDLSMIRSFAVQQL